MAESNTRSRQQAKSHETKSRILKATKYILQEQGYESLSIKNICDEAGVSNGSFYHHFKTKDDLLSYYIEEQRGINPDLLAVPEHTDEAKIAIIHIYLNYARSLRELGVEFISSYFVPANQALCPDQQTGRPYPIVTAGNYLQKAIDVGAVTPRIPLEDILTDIRMLILGNVFEWCLHHGDTDFEGNIRRSFTNYLDSVL